MKDYMIVQNAIGSNGFTTDDTSAGYVNPEFWNRNVLRFLEEKLVVLPLGRTYDDLLGGPGNTLNITVDDTPSAAATVAETDDVSITAQSHSQVVFTPTEYGAAYQLHDKEARRAFLDEMENMSMKIGYSLALAADDDAITTTTAGAGNAVVANGVAASALASSDTLDYSDVVDAAKELMTDKFQPRAIVVGPASFAALAKDSQFSYANQAASTETLREGRIGRIFGLDVYWTTQIVADSDDVETNLVFGESATGDPAFGVARKLLPEINTEYHALGRYTDIVGVAEWDVQILRANGICTLKAHSGA